MLLGLGITVIQVTCECHADYNTIVVTQRQLIQPLVVADVGTERSGKKRLSCARAPAGTGFRANTNHVFHSGARFVFPKSLRSYTA